MPDEDIVATETGSWQERVRFGPGASFAYRPGELLVPMETADHAERTLMAWADENRDSIDVSRLENLGSYAHFRGSFSPAEALRQLHEQGLHGQVNHVLFASSCGCPPHPSTSTAGQVDADPFMANPFMANPFMANPFMANPFMANPFMANPFMANLSGCCGCNCGCGCGRGPMANPFMANPFMANPFMANASPSPFADASSQRSGVRSSSARPADAPTSANRPEVQGVRVTVLDTGWADENYAPTGLAGINVVHNRGDRPDEDGDGYVDPAAGHAVFIAGVIEQLTPGCEIELIRVLSTYGDGDEVTITRVLEDLARRPEPQRPHIVNLSFGGYSPVGMAALKGAISQLHGLGTVIVAAAGNDSSCYPQYPAALGDVVGVGALDPDGKPATYTNYGPWVDASAPGTNLVSLFFEGFNGVGPPENNYDPDDFNGWARWSGTSFAAPVVVAALAREVAGGLSPGDAVDKLIKNKKLTRIPLLGTVVDPMK